jgi:hypothetical protein
MLVFEPSNAPIRLEADTTGEAVLVIGSAVPHEHELHLGPYSVHTSDAALQHGHANIERLRQLLVSAGDRRTACGTIPVFRGETS